MLKNYLGLTFWGILFLGALISCGHGSKKIDDENHQNQEQSEKLELKAITFNNSVKDSIRETKVTGIIITTSHKVAENHLKSETFISSTEFALNFTLALESQVPPIA